MNVLLYTEQLINSIYLVVNQNAWYCKVYGVENVNAFIVLKYFHNIVVYFIQVIKMWQCLVYHLKKEKKNWGDNRE